MALRAADPQEQIEENREGRHVRARWGIYGPIWGGI